MKVESAFDRGPTDLSPLATSGNKELTPGFTCYPVFVIGFRSRSLLVSPALAISLPGHPELINVAERRRRVYVLLEKMVGAIILQQTP